MLDRLFAGHDAVLIGPDDAGLLDAVAAGLPALGIRAVRVAAAAAGPLTVAALVAQLTGAHDVTVHDDATLERAFQALSAVDPGVTAIVLIVAGADRLHRSAIRYLDFTIKTSPQLRLLLAGRTDPAPAFEPAAPALHRRLTALPAITADPPAIAQSRPIPPPRSPPLLLAPKPPPSVAPALPPKPAVAPPADAAARLARAPVARERTRRPMALPFAVAACVVAGAGLATLALRPAVTHPPTQAVALVQPVIPVIAAAPQPSPAPPLSLADAIASPTPPPEPDFTMSEPEADPADAFTPPVFAPPPSTEPPKREARQAPRRPYQRPAEPRRAYYGDTSIGRGYEQPGWRTPYAYAPPFAGGAEQPSIGSYVLMPDGRRVFRLNR